MVTDPNISKLSTNANCSLTGQKSGLFYSCFIELMNQCFAKLVKHPQRRWSSACRCIITTFLLCFLLLLSISLFLCAVNHVSSFRSQKLLSLQVLIWQNQQWHLMPLPPGGGGWLFLICACSFLNTVCPERSHIRPITAEGLIFLKKNG